MTTTIPEDMKRPHELPPLEKFELKRWNKQELARKEMHTFLKNTIRAACGELVSDAAILNIIASIQSERMQLWKLEGKAGNETYLVGVLTTVVIDDKMMGRKYLNIGMANIYEGFEDELWEMGFSTLLKFAEEKQCDLIETDIVNDAIIERMQHLGFIETSRKMLREV